MDTQATNSLDWNLCFAETRMGAFLPPYTPRTVALDYMPYFAMRSPALFFSVSSRGRRDDLAGAFAASSPSA